MHKYYNLKLQNDFLLRNEFLGAKCTTFPQIKNGFITDLARTYYYNDEARVQCFKGYKLIGNSILRCGENHQFNNPPKCDGKN